MYAEAYIKVTKLTLEIVAWIVTTEKWGGRQTVQTVKRIHNLMPDLMEELGDEDREEWEQLLKHIEKIVDEKIGIVEN